MKSIILSLFLLICSLAVLAQSGSTGLRGTVKNKQGEVLPFAAVIVKGTPNGTITNAEGRYEIGLAPGNYEIVFQYLGFQTIQKSVEVTAGFTTLDATLEEQALRLAEVQTKAGNEDPAYTIMRRAIAKSRFHQLQVQRFKARVYTKSSITVTDLPNLAEMAFKKQLKEAEREANFKVGVPMLNETISEVSFSQPNTYRQRIIANRNSQGDFLNPSQFFNASFYDPVIAGTVSPLSPKAFAYYKFEYKGTFRETGPGGTPVEVSKIQVIPRQYGEGVFRGTIYILENTWAIHSLQLETVNNIGISFIIRHLCSPVQGVWMPVNQRYSGKGSYLGVKAEGYYIRNLTFSEFVVNPAFVEDIEVADEKKAPPTQTLSKGEIKGAQLDELVKKQKEFSTKNLRQMVKEYEKQEKEARKKRKEDVAVVRNDSMVVDSMARKRSNTFWDSLRSVPLTTAEIKSYNKADSLGLIRQIKTKVELKADSTRQDSLNKNKKKKTFGVDRLLFGHTWRLAKRTSLAYTSPIERIEYNTVEGYTLEGALNLRYTPKVDSVHRFMKIPLGEWTVGGTGRYQFGRKQFVGYGQLGYQYRNTKLGISGGRYLNQFNPDNPISPFLNSLTTLLFEQNFIKLYQKDYLNLTVNASPFHDRLKVTGSLEYAQRTELANYREDLKPWIDWRNRTFTPNRPDNAEVTSTAFPTHNALVLNLSASARLGSTEYIIRNGRRIARRANDAPVLTLNYRKGMADADYDFLQATISHSFETGIRSRLNYQLSAGAFVNDRQVYFPDFKHFAGNEFFFQQGDAVSTYRLLPYYQYSTGKRFAEAHVLAEFRKFFITQLTLVRLIGLKENLFVHYLYTPASKNYTEVGYGLDGLIPQVFPFFRVEVISQWQDAKYQGLGFRIGTTLKFGG
ncbi:MULTISPECIES: DUF5686 and carboxypeptidase regulatory-like domain-containing protein [unclassified Spirosoma]|uniref:DUF5686 and carboxypeptidase regulatory-like domain-containing protein n=1 Tax=unclassified Spirosoma TaxID=2621999 RepID=UPI00095C7E47|nr:MULTISPECIES: DUF5686 and carboxypeptidase regulatory-like domain-containing protein [unclassified Spirosoma]MBN8822383.1 carboxypeptidase-like regulatory domain-containing protein [Spirosoma sp.]OJW72320.1 MAG: hypothetical protein BGO59_14340 [Spirosoma sp. 48-14]